MNIFNDFPIGLFVMQLVILLVLLFLLTKFAWKPIMKALSDREEGIKNALDEAENARKEMQNLQANNERLAKEARAERDELLKEAREIKDKLISEAKEEANYKAEKLILASKNSIEQEKRAALADIKEQVAVLSIDIAKKVVGNDLSSSENHLKLVENLLEEVKL